jgi:hypothetical protein
MILNLDQRENLSPMDWPRADDLFARAQKRLKRAFFHSLGPLRQPHDIREPWRDQITRVGHSPKEMSSQCQSLINCIQDLCGNLDARSAGANNSSPGPAGRTCLDAISASGENGQIPVALKSCSQLLIVTVRPHAG